MKRKENPETEEGISMASKYHNEIHDESHIDNYI